MQKSVFLNELIPLECIQLHFCMYLSVHKPKQHSNLNSVVLQKLIQGRRNSVNQTFLTRCSLQQDFGNPACFLFLQHLFSLVDRHRGHGRKAAPITALCILKETFCNGGNFHASRTYRSQSAFLLHVACASILKRIRRDQNVPHCNICLRQMEHLSASEKNHSESGSAKEADASLQLYADTLTRYRSACPTFHSGWRPRFLRLKRARVRHRTERRGGPRLLPTPPGLTASRALRGPAPGRPPGRGACCDTRAERDVSPGALALRKPPLLAEGQRSSVATAGPAAPGTSFLRIFEEVPVE